MSEDNLPSPSKAEWIKKASELLDGVYELSKSEIFQKNIALALVKGTGKVIKAGLDVPTTYFEGLAQQKRDRTEAKSIVSKAAAEAAAKKYSSDDGLAYRAVDYFQEDLFRKQANRESIAGKTIDKLNDLDIDSFDFDNIRVIDEDWLTLFWRTAEEKSSNELQEIFSKILLGEVVTPGSTNPQTLHILALLTQRTGLIFTNIASFIVDFKPSGLFETCVIFDNNQHNSHSVLKDFLKAEDLDLLIDVGLLRPSEWFGHSGEGLILVGGKRASLKYTSQLYAYKLTSAGKEIHCLIKDIDPNLEYINSMNKYSKLFDLKI